MLQVFLYKNNSCQTFNESEMNSFNIQDNFFFHL